MSTTTAYRREWAIQDCEIRRSGGGREVTAYAAVFNTPTEIHDQHGDYIEVIDPGAFDAWAASKQSQPTVLYNHGFDVRGRSGGLPTVPIGRALEVKPDGRGLLTRSLFNNSELANAVLASIGNGDITSYSFEGPIYRSDPQAAPGKAQPGRALPTVTRMRLGVRNYGPTPTPYYQDARITAVRTRSTPEQARRRLALWGAEQDRRERAQEYVAELLRGAKFDRLAQESRDRQEWRAALSAKYAEMNAEFRAATPPEKRAEWDRRDRQMRRAIDQLTSRQSPAGRVRR